MSHKEGYVQFPIKEDAWSIAIEKVENGFILHSIEDYADAMNDDCKKYEKELIEEADGELGELKAMERLLWRIKEKFGMYSSNHNEYNLNVSIRDENDEEFLVEK